MFGTLTQAVFGARQVTPLGFLAGPPARVVCPTRRAADANGAPVCVLHLTPVEVADLAQRPLTAVNSGTR